MFNSSINVRLKVLFNKMYLSRNIFEKMKSLINSIDVGSYSYDFIISRANEIVSTLNNITNDIQGLLDYNNYINQIKDQNDAYNTNFEIIFNLLITRYTQIIDELFNEIENDRLFNETNDRDYKNLTLATPVEFNQPETDEKGKFFIPTDDVYPWNTITKDKFLGSNNLIVFSDDYQKMDPKNEDETSVNSGGVKSKDFSLGSMTIDVLMNIEKSGFSLSTINSKTNEVYPIIEDDYEANISIGTNKSYFDGEFILENDLYTTKPKPGLLMNIKEFKKYDLSIRRHGEFSDNPTKFFASIK